MALYPNTPFVEGQIVTPDLLYTAFNPVFDGETQYLGHQPLLTDANLSNAAGQLKQRVANITDNFKVSPGSGLSVNFATGSLINNNDLITIASGSLAVPAASSFFVFINKNNNMVASDIMPAVRVPLAYVTTSTNAVLSVTDLRTGGGYPILAPNLSAISTFGGQGEDGSFNAVNGQELTLGEYNFSSFNVPAGVTVFVKQFTKIRVSGNCTIAGTIDVQVNGFNIGGIYSVTAGVSIPGSSNRGIGSRTGEIPADPYTPAQQPFGSDGCSGSVSAVGAYDQVISVIAAPAGSGGGGFIMDVGGTFTLEATGRIRCNGTEGGNAYEYGQAGSGTTTSFSGAGSGGSGGYISLKSTAKATIRGTLEASGGAGGSGAATNGTWSAEGGNGGGGGYVSVIAPVIDLVNSTIVVSGGAGAGSYDYSNSARAINTPGGSFGGRGGSAAGTNGNNGTIGIFFTKQAIPNPS